MSELGDALRRLPSEHVKERNRLASRADDQDGRIEELTDHLSMVEAELDKEKRYHASSQRKWGRDLVALQQAEADLDKVRAERDAAMKAVYKVAEDIGL